MRTFIALDTDSFNYHIYDEGTPESAKDVRQLISLAKLAIVDLQDKLGSMLNEAIGVETLKDQSLAKNQEQPQVKTPEIKVRTGRKR